ncbi:MAG: TonB-dependent receptor plug domain-containing protein [Bacteroidota bacterium]
MKKQTFKINWKHLLIFNEWKRKGYSVFTSLNKVVKITTLNLAYSIVLLPVQVLSQTDTINIKNHDLDEVIVSAQKSPVVYSQLSRVVTTIDYDEIRLMPVSSINDILENFSGIDIRQRGVHGVQADISIRGGSFDQNLILLNGVNISDPQTGHHSLNLPIDIHSVERIEILEGSGSRVFGPNAFSGAINFITNQADENYTKLNLGFGDFGLFSSNLSSAYRIKNTRHFLSFSKSGSNGYTQNTDFDHYNLFYHLNYDSDFGKIDFQTGFTDKQFGANSFYTPAYPDQFEQTKTTFTSIKFETGNKLKLIPVIYFRRHQDRFELFRNEPAEWYSGHNYHLTDVYGAKLDSRISTKAGVTTFGTEIRSENIWSNVLGIPMDDTIKAFGEADGFYDKNYSRTISNYFIEHSLSYKKLSVTAGMLASWVSENHFDFNIYPGVDVNLTLLDWLSWYGSVNKSLRLPTFTDLFYSGPSNIGNPELKPEESWSYETGLKYYTNKIKANYYIFYRDSEDLIAWVKPLNAQPEEKWETQNLTQVTTFGFGAHQRIIFKEIEFSHLNHIDINYSYLSQESSSGDYETKYSLNYLKHNLIVNFSHQIVEHLNFSWMARYQDRAGSFLYYDQDAGIYTHEKEFEPYWLFDAKISYQMKWINIYSEITNIFDIKYFDISNINMPGRWLKAGVQFKINYQ